MEALGAAGDQLLEPVFEYAGPSSVESIGESTVLGPWSLASKAAGGQLAFDMTAPTQPEAPTWRANLPGDPALAEAVLRQAEAQIGASHDALSTVPGRLESTLEQASQALRAGNVSFDLDGAAGQVSSPEAGLLSWVQQAQASAAPTVLDFGVSEADAGRLEQVRVQFSAFVQRVNQLLLHAAWVETRRDGELLAHSVVGWAGGPMTVWRLRAQRDDLDWHARSLALALASRLLWLQTAITVSQGAIKVSLLLATPGGAVMAAPAVWKYVNEVLALAGQHQKLAEKPA